MTDLEKRKNFMHLLRQGVHHKFQTQQKIKKIPLTDIAGKGKAHAGETRDGARHALLPEEVVGFVAWQTLVWRDAFSTKPYFHESVDGKPLRIKQVLQGELNGFGTGLTVWPAACVLLKHLEYRVANNSKVLINSNNPFVLELGSGTGAVGIAAAMLLQAGRVALTDMDNVRFIMQENVDLAQQDGVIDTNVVVNVHVYEWGHSPPSSLILPSEHVYPDLILVSDCILPRLYPIEPLVEALTILSKSYTRILISYEHRYYQHFEPKQKFWELMKTKKFSLRVIGANEYHPHFAAADIEVWEIFPPA